MGQALLHHRIDLPDLVGRLPLASILGRTPPGWTVDPRDVEPALEGAFRGAWMVGPGRPQLNEDEDGAPSGMSVLELTGGLDQLRITTGTWATAVGIVGAES